MIMLAILLIKFVSNGQIKKGKMSINTKRCNGLSYLQCCT